jgi:hypothetical protein
MITWIVVELWAGSMRRSFNPIGNKLPRTVLIHTIENKLHVIAKVSFQGMAKTATRTQPATANIPDMARPILSSSFQKSRKDSERIVPTASPRMTVI